MDSFSIEVPGGQEGAAYNGRYRQTAYHPLVASFAVGGDYDGTREVDFRLDAGYTGGEVFDFLEDEKTRFLGRLRTNAVRDRLAAPYRRRLPGRPPKGGYETIIELGPRRAESWRRAYRLILFVVDRADPSILPASVRQAERGSHPATSRSGW